MQPQSAVCIRSVANDGEEIRTKAPHHRVNVHHATLIPLSNRRRQLSVADDRQHAVIYIHRVTRTYLMSWVKFPFSTTQSQPMRHDCCMRRSEQVQEGPGWLDVDDWRKEGIFRTSTSTRSSLHDPFLGGEILCHFFSLPTGDDMLSRMRSRSLPSPAQSCASKAPWIDSGMFDDQMHSLTPRARTSCLYSPCLAQHSKNAAQSEPKPPSTGPSNAPMR